MSWEQGRKSGGRQVDPGRGDYGMAPIMFSPETHWAAVSDLLLLPVRLGKSLHPSELQFSYQGASNSSRLTGMT